MDTADTQTTPASLSTGNIKRWRYGAVSGDSATDPGRSTVGILSQPVDSLAMLKKNSDEVAKNQAIGEQNQAKIAAAQRSRDEASRSYAEAWENKTPGKGRKSVAPAANPDQPVETYAAAWTDALSSSS